MGWIILDYIGLESRVTILLSHSSWVIHGRILTQLYLKYKHCILTETDDEEMAAFSNDFLRNCTETPEKQGYFYK